VAVYENSSRNSHFWLSLKKGQLGQSMPFIYLRKSPPQQKYLISGADLT
jgi:hypothetical protein